MESKEAIVVKDELVQLKAQLPDMLTVSRKGKQGWGRFEQSERRVVYGQSPEEGRGAPRMHLPAGAGDSRGVLNGEVCGQMIDKLCCIEEAFKGVRHVGDGGGEWRDAMWCV